MDKKKLKKHIRLCRKNLKSNRVICCAECPFEKEIVDEYPDIEELFKNKRNLIINRGK